MSAEFERDVEIWQDIGLLHELTYMNFTKETVSFWWSQLSKIDDKRRSIKEPLVANGGNGDEYVKLQESEEKPVLLSQGSSRILSSLYRSLLFILQNDAENLASYRLMRMREYKYGTILNI
jgi:hypothetical protein